MCWIPRRSSLRRWSLRLLSFLSTVCVFFLSLYVQTGVAKSRDLINKHEVYKKRFSRTTIRPATINHGFTHAIGPCAAVFWFLFDCYCYGWCGVLELVVAIVSSLSNWEGVNTVSQTACTVRKGIADPIDALQKPSYRDSDPYFHVVRVRSRYPASFCRLPSPPPDPKHVE